MVLALVPVYETDGLAKLESVAVVVPTAGLYEINASRWAADITSLRRLDKGQSLASKHRVPLIISGGHTREGAPSEAEVLAAHAKPAWREIVLETGSRNTYATGKNVKKLLKGMRSGPVLVVTSPSHCLRTAAVFQNMGIPVRVVPSLDIPWIHQRRSYTEPKDLLPYTEPKDLLPSLEGLTYANRAFTEVAAILWYLANGRITPDDLFSSL